jgi:hypothetical protein
MTKKIFFLTFFALIFIIIVFYLFNSIYSNNECGWVNVEKDLIYGSEPDRYNYWLCYASSGWADKEQFEFKVLNDKYGIPGNPNTHGYINNEIAIWVSQDIPSHPKYFLIISLYKNTKTKGLRMAASLEWKASDVACGNPRVEMDIPMKEFNSIVDKWLSSENIQLLIDAAEAANWRPIKADESFTEKPRIKVTYLSQKDQRGHS